MPVPSPPRTSIAAVSLSGTLPEKLEAAATIGFDGVEIFENDLLTHDGSPADVRNLARSLDLSLICYQPFRDFEAMPDTRRDRDLDRAERKFDTLQALGIDLMLVCGNVHSQAIDDDDRATADLARLAERARRRGLRIAYEALAWGRHVNRWRHAWKIVQAADHPALGLCLDSFHTLAIGDDLTGIDAVPGEKIFLLQLADAPRLVMDTLSWSRHFRGFPGQGQLPVADFLRGVMATGYTGPLSLEIFNDNFRSAPARIIARDGLRSLRLLMAEAGLTDLPPASALDGFEFVEFAVDDDTGRRLGETFRALGFHHAGEHRSKAVSLFRQGGANFVLNAEPDSAAAGHFHFHGTSVCAIGLRTQNVAAAIARADTLLCPEWREPIGEGEQYLSALRAPDGTLINLLASDAAVYESDFNLVPIPSADDDVTIVDHIAQALPAGRMENFVLFYKAILGLSAEDPWEIPDPQGLVRSRTMVNDTRTVRLPLNISENHATTTGRFVTAHSGAGVHHIALATTDIERAVTRLRACGVAMLPIPANYHDDVAAKWGLDDDRLARLREFNLLYDRDDHGEFLHAYTDTFDGRFFFEIVQRIGGYRGFGAANAAVRIAAQAVRR